MSKKKFSSVWDAIEDTPQQAAARNVRHFAATGVGGVAPFKHG